jgi:nucleolar pre-ribosomal-associated protein 1
VSDIGILHLVTRILLRLCLLPGERIPNIEELLTKIVQIMPEMVGDDLQLDEETKMEPQIPHTAFRLHEKESPNSARAWGETIEGLWRVSMTLDNKIPAWDYLTARLLFWRSVQKEESLIGEWARQEVVRALLDLEHR